MAPTPEVQTFIDLMTEMFPAIGTDVTSAVEAREILASRPPVELPEIEVASAVDETVPGPAGPVPVRVYRPLADPGPVPLVVFSHGGGWVLCDLDTHDRFARTICADVGAVVVSVDYRRAPEHRFPAAAEDAYAATAWAAAVAADLGADPARLVVAGDSAGGNLAAATAVMARDRGGPSIAYQLLVYPVLDHRFDSGSYRENGSGYFLTETHMRWYWEQYLGPGGDGTHPYASPLRADLSGLPPACVVTAELDPLRDEGEAFAETLGAAGVDVTLQRADGLFHGFFSLADVLPAADDAARRALATLRSALTSPSVSS